MTSHHDRGGFVSLSTDICCGLSGCLSFLAFSLKLLLVIQLITGILGGFKDFKHRRDLLYVELTWNCLGSEQPALAKICLPTVVGMR